MPDFGIFRGFNEKLFGDKLVAGQLPTQLGLIGSEDFGFDPDALAFFARVTTAGGTLSETEQAAINTLVVQMKADGIWTKMKAIYPMVGASSAACAQNLKSSSFTGTFSGGWTFASTGATPNGTNAYMDTSINPNTELQLNSVHLSNYFPSLNNEQKFQIGTISLVSGTYNGLYVGWSFNSPNGLARLNDAQNTFFQDINAASGYNIITRTSVNNSKTYINGTNTTSSSGASDNLPLHNIYIAARNFEDTADSFSNSEQSFASIGDGLNDTEASNLYTAVQAFQTTLSREV